MLPKENDIQIAREVCRYVQGVHDGSVLRSLYLSLTDTQKELVHSSLDEYFYLERMVTPIPNTSEVYPKYGPISKAIELFNTKGHRQEVRKELRDRYKFLAYDEQMQVKQTMMAGAKLDRLWLCRYYRHNWDEEQLSTIISMYEQYHDREAAFLVVKHAPVDYIKAHEEDLVSATSYLHVRLRYPASDSINYKKLLFDEDLLYLFAKQHIDFSEFSRYVDINEALRSVVINSYHEAYSSFMIDKPYEGFLLSYRARRVVWCLAQLGQTDLILKLIDLERETMRHADDKIPYIIESIISNFVFITKKES